MVSASLVTAVISTLPLAFAKYHKGGDGYGDGYGGKNGYGGNDYDNSYGNKANKTSYGTPSATAAASKGVQTISVGKDGLTFTPDSINANIGDQIVFEFSPKNHSIVQSEFKTPCVPKDGGMYSGFVPSAAGLANTTFTITVSDEKPIWLYCSQNKPKPHCAAGMVAVINPPKEGANNLEAYKKLAEKTDKSSSPAGGPSGGKICIDHGSSPAAPGSAPPSSPSAPSAPSASSAPSAPSPPYPIGSSTLVASGTGSVPTGTGAILPTDTGAASAPGNASSTSSPPSQFTGAASSLAFSGALGAMGLLAGVLL